MKLFNLFKKKPAPEPWDGVHRLEYVRYREHMAYPDDYYTGWVWKCSCGTGNHDRIPPQWKRSEEDAILAFKIHRSRYYWV